jgi:uncharacterized membrane protein YkvA (DUF1232 family)
MRTAWSKLRAWAKALKRDVHALYFAARDRRTPWTARIAAMLVAGYVLSPIDLIPDFIPVLGYLDDVILAPIGVWLVIKLIPPDLFAEYRQRAAEAAVRPTSRVGAAAIVAIWIALAVAALVWVWRSRG